MADSKNELICPLCGEKMVKIFSPEKQIYIDICLNGCGGILFDNRELEKFDEKQEDCQFILDAIKDKEFKKHLNNEQLVCPVCNHKMVKNPAGLGAGCEIDICYSCGAKFLDNGELEKIRNQEGNESERSQAFAKEFTKIYMEDYKKLDTETKEQKEFLTKWEKIRYIILIAIFVILILFIKSLLG